ncbi:MAG: patatin-like phospholipase family protein [Woeseia sp.]
MRHSVPRAGLFSVCMAAGLFLSAEAGAAEPSAADPGERLRVGLVLGGGGARGAAHIGVLRELEKMRVPVDAIAGTSMGAVVGGLYAAGMSPGEIEQLLAELDWAEVFQDTSRRGDLTYRRKQDDVEFPVDFELGLVDGRLRLPKGLIQGQKLNPLLRRLTLDVAHIHNFDRLPTPFRAVAADIETGEPVVLSEGDLSLAMRASMSAPGIFAPVLVDGRLLVDGGLAGNLPVDTMKEMGVDVVIAVDVEFPLYTRDELDSAVGITAQVLTILIRKETQRQLAALDEDDVLIRPELGNFGSTNFAGITGAVEPGAEATVEHRAELQTLALNEPDYRRYLASRYSLTDRDVQVAFVRVLDAGPLSARVLESRLETTVGNPIDTRTLARDVSRLYGLDLYEHVGYRLLQEDGQTGVVFETVPKSWGPNLVQLGVSLEDDFEGSTAFNVSGRLTRAGVNALAAEWRTDLQIGTEPYLASEFYQPLSFDSRYFVAPRIRLEQANLKAFAADMTVARYRVGEAEIALDFGRELGRWGEVRVGAFRGMGDARVVVGEADIPNIDFRNGGLFASFGVDTLDDGQIPHSGMRVDTTVTMSRPGFGADSSFDAVESTISRALTFGRHTFQLGLEFNTTIQSDDLIQNFFPLGGFLRLSGLERGQISGPHAGLGRLLWMRRSGETGGGLFDVPLYLGASVEAGNVWQSRSDIAFDSLLINGSAFAGLDTFFGPLFLAAGLAEGGGSSFYLFLGTLPR